MSERPTVSVCIPAYNHEMYIADCIESVLKQTVSDFEIVITDDASRDGTVAEIEKFSDKRIRLFRSEKNRGPSATANNNLRQARGKYACFLASDDMFHPEKLERQLAYLEANPQIGVVFSYMRYVSEEGTPLDDYVGYRYTDVANRSREAWLRNFFFEGNGLSAPTAMMRREVYEKVGLLDNRLLQTQDFDFWIRACLHFEIHVLPERLVDYRVRANQQNTSAATPDKQAQTYWELSKVLEHFCHIDDEALLYRIFPEAEYLRCHSLPVSVVVALMALQAQVRSTRVFGLDLLYKAFADDEIARSLEEIGYDLPAFYNLIKDVDALGMKDVAKAQEDTANAMERVSTLKAEYDWIADQARRWEERAVNTAKRADHWNKEYQQALKLAHEWEKKHERSKISSRVRRIFSKLQWS